MAEKKQDKGKGLDTQSKKEKNRQREIVPVQWDQIFSI